jgi:AcrR family transcriptional regulator
MERGGRLPVASGPLSRAQILDATAACLRDHGYDGTTIRRIASLLDCAVGSIYRYFLDKRELLAAVTQRRFEPVCEAIEAGVSPERAAALYARIAAEQPQQYRLMIWLASVGVMAAAAPLPEVVQRIIGGCAEQLGSTEAAEDLWSRLHASVMLGRAVDPMLSAEVAASRAGDPAGAPLEITIVATEVPKPRHQAAPPPPLVEVVAEEEREDLTLL